MKSIKFKIFLKLLFLPLLVRILFSCNQNTDQGIGVFAAAGTMLPLNEICELFESENNTKIAKNYAASGALARQINAGAETDIYISANEQWINFLLEKNLLNHESITKLTFNKLVIVCPIDNNINLNFSKDFDIKSAIIDKISIGDPKYVPAGKYAKQFLDSLTWYNQIQDRIVLAKDVTSVLNYVELRECDWGIVYYSEAIKSNKVRIIYEVPQDLYSPIIFYIALLNNTEESKKLYEHIKNIESKKVFEKYGFTLDKKE